MAFLIDYQKFIEINRLIEVNFLKINRLNNFNQYQPCAETLADTNYYSTADKSNKTTRDDNYCSNCLITRSAFSIQHDDCERWTDITRQHIPGHRMRAVVKRRPL